jgi:hypothetical protein
MDGRRFDAISRSIAAKTTRRQAACQLGAGGMLTALATVSGTRSLRAQSDEFSVCIFQIRATVEAGGNQGRNLDGVLTLEIDPLGNIDGGNFELPDGSIFDVVGQATGRALSVRIELEGDEVLTLTGTAERDLILCRGEASGLFGGPDMGDIGTWAGVTQIVGAG